MEKYREGQKELHCGFVELEKAYDKVQREEVWYCMRKSGLVEKYVRILQDMYDDSTTAVRCAVGVTEGFEMKVGLHQGSALSPCLFAMVKREERRNFYLKSNKMVNTTLANSLLRRLHTQYVPHNIQYLQQIYK